MKPTDSSERLKALMRQHTQNVAIASPITTTATTPPPSGATQPAPRQTVTATAPIAPKVRWDRITVRLTIGELQKINDVVIATQQTNRTAKVTITDIVRVGLQRIKANEAISAGEIKTVKASDARLPRSISV